MSKSRLGHHLRVSEEMWKRIQDGRAKASERGLEVGDADFARTALAVGLRELEHNPARALGPAPETPSRQNDTAE